ncbi:uncharacterized protein LOC112461432, partial [Temnothorax curvispinosus]|uniref:Uncharacterized protein LOC112461432 n=1 Tax=Temnothorax curvispinosus TaxID=300111 RepID=A0A6J1QJ52_9HYME
MGQYEMKEEMLKLARETCRDPKEIFDSVCRSNPSIGQYLSFPSIRCTMHRERINSRPSVPDTLASLRDMLPNSDMLKDFYKGSIITSCGNTAIILSTNDLIDALSSATEIYVDGTFS